MTRKQRADSLLNLICVNLPVQYPVNKISEFGDTNTLKY